MCQTHTGRHLSPFKFYCAVRLSVQSPLPATCTGQAQHTYELVCERAYQFVSVHVSSLGNLQRGRQWKEKVSAKHSLRLSLRLFYAAVPS